MAWLDTKIYIVHVRVGLSFVFSTLSEYYERSSQCFSYLNTVKDCLYGTKVGLNG